MRIVFLGTADFAVPSLYRLIMAGHDVALVVTQPDRPRGRGRRPGVSPVKEMAQRFGIPVYQPERIRAAEAVETICRVGAEVLVVVAYGQILPRQLLDCVPLGGINLHGSLLPAYRGAAPIQRAIMAGERVTGVTTMHMTEEMDAGDIILQRQCAIGEDSYGELSQRLALLGADLLQETLDQLHWGTAPRVPQDASRATYAPPLQRGDERIDWRCPARDVVNRVRALSPAPGAVTRVGDSPLKILRARVVPGVTGRAPGEVVEVVPGEGFVVQAGDEAVLVLEVQPAGRRRMPAADYLRGHRLPPGTRLVAPAD